MSYRIIRHGASIVRAYSPVTAIVITVLGILAEAMRLSCNDYLVTYRTSYSGSTVSVVRCGSMILKRAVFLTADGTLRLLLTGCSTADMRNICGSRYRTTYGADDLGSAISVICLLSMIAVLKVTAHALSQVAAKVTVGFAPRSKLMSLCARKLVRHSAALVRAYSPVAVFIVFVFGSIGEAMLYRFNGNAAAYLTAYSGSAVSVVFDGSMRLQFAVLLTADGTLRLLRAGCFAAGVRSVCGDDLYVTYGAVYRGGAISVVGIGVIRYLLISALTFSLVLSFLCGLSPFSELVRLLRGSLIRFVTSAVGAYSPVTALVVAVFRITCEAMSLCGGYRYATLHTLDGGLAVSVIRIRTMCLISAVFLTADGTLCTLVTACNTAGMRYLCGSSRFTADSTGGSGRAISVVLCRSVSLKVTVELTAHVTRSLLRAGCFAAAMSVL